jgi:hypothetical protein
VGYGFTADDVKGYNRAAKKAGREVSDAELDGIAAGLDNPFSTSRPW